MGSFSPMSAPTDLRLLSEVLEPLLGRSRAQTSARALLADFGSLGAVMSAPHERLELILEDEGARVAGYVLGIRRVMIATLRQRLENRPLLNSDARLVSYLRTLLSHQSIEHFRVLYLDASLHLIADELLGTGTVDQAPVYPREVIRRALDVGAKNLILVHNHPSGNPTPSQNDIASTRRIAASAAVFEIELLDHYVVGRGHVQSMKQLGLICPGRLHVDYEPRGYGRVVVRTGAEAGAGARGRCGCRQPAPGPGEGAA